MGYYVYLFVRKGEKVYQRQIIKKLLLTWELVAVELSRDSLTVVALVTVALVIHSRSGSKQTLINNTGINNTWGGRPTAGTRQGAAQGVPSRAAAPAVREDKMYASIQTFIILLVLWNMKKNQ